MNCPTSAELRHWLAGQLPEAESRRIENHVEHCTAVCQPLLDDMSGFGDECETEYSWIKLPPLVEAELPEAPPWSPAAAPGPWPAMPEPARAHAATTQTAMIGHYRVLGKLGQGGMGNVYKALHVKLEKVVALKLLPTELMRNPQAVARFRREIRAVGRLNHPNIVIAHDADDADGMPYLVMELVDGIDLATLVRRRGRLPIATACELVRQAALGLEHAHEHGLVHRDVKPSNLMLAFAHGENRPSVKILDLGLALLDEPATELSAQMTISGLVMGTLDYMAPEQASDTHMVDGRADVYGLGATLFKLLTGQAPFVSGDYKTTLSRLAALAAAVAPNVTALRSEVPGELATVVRKMTAKDPAARFQTPREAAEALAPFADNADLGAFCRELTGSATAKSASPLNEADLETLSSQLRQGTVTGLAATNAWTPADGTAQHGFFSLGKRGRVTAILATAAGMAAIVAAVLALNGLERYRAQQRSANERNPADSSSVVNGKPATPAHGQPDSTASNGQQRPATAPAASEKRELKLLVPAYFYPAGDGLREWDRLIAAASDAKLIAVANPASGPGEAFDTNYKRVIRRGVRAGVEIIGYVATAYGDRPAAEVKADIDRWLKFYPAISGFFFDALAGDAGQVAHYADLYAYVKERLPDGLVVANRGASCDRDYFERPAADVICIFENRQGFDVFRRPADLPASAAGRLAVLLYNVTGATEMRKHLTRAAGERITYSYLTDDVEKNPWDRLPTFWEEEVAAIRKLNE